MLAKTKLNTVDIMMNYRHDEFVPVNNNALKNMMKWKKESKIEIINKSLNYI